MKKYLTLFIMVVGATAGFAQTVKGVVKDMVTHKPIEFVTVSTDDFKFNTISNSEGAFRLRFNPGVGKITFSHLGYKDYHLKLSNLPADSIFYLEPKNFEVEEVVIMNTPINEFLRKLIDNSKASQTSPLQLKGYYREFLNFNGHYVKFADALTGYTISGNGKKVKPKLSVKQSRAKQLASYKEGFVRALVDVRKTAALDCNFEVPEYIFFSGKGYKDYDYTFKSRESEGGENLMVISFSPKRGLKKNLFEGSIVYNPTKNIILNIDVKMVEGLKQYAEESSFLFIARYKDLEFVYKSAFRDTDGRYSLSFSSLNGSVRIWRKNAYDNTYIFKNDLIITETLPQTPDSKADAYHERSLYESGSNYTDKFWEGNNAIQLTPEEEKIVQSLENKTL